MNESIKNKDHEFRQILKKEKIPNTIRGYKSTKKQLNKQRRQVQAQLSDIDTKLGLHNKTTREEIQTDISVAYNIPLEHITINTYHDNINIIFEKTNELFIILKELTECEQLEEYQINADLRRNMITINMEDKEC